jgi:hypothetical protein
MTIGAYYYDPENERIMQFLGAAWDNASDGPNPLSFRDFETGEQVELFEFEMAEEWPHMNAMEVIAWASR